MNVRTLLAASLTLAFATATAFAQDTPAEAAPPADQMAPAAPAMATDSKPMSSMHHMRMHHAMHHRMHHGMHHGMMRHGHGHVAGDPAVIDRSADHMIVTPTATKIPMPAMAPASGG